MAASTDKDSAKVKVAVRIRPLNRRELALGCKVCLAVDVNSQIVLHHPLELEGETAHDQNPQNPALGKSPKSFAFDHCFWSCSPKDADFASQETVFNALGVDILDNAFGGYNACIFAYGQTGSGKSFSMMGTDDQKGIIPRLCDRMFERIAQSNDKDLECKVEVSYMEIYNEKVHDLLDPRGTKQNLKVREHNILGPYVDGLSQLAVSSFDDIDNLMSEGNKQRTVAATNMNSESSRSHAVFTVILTQSRFDRPSGLSGEKVSKMSLVDLAGSERAQKTGAEGSRLREGSNINKSLSTLGLVISSLADATAGKGKGKFVPYRDSVLTWILKDNLGGNSRTVMVATLSPAADNYEETLSTLRYADRAKRIVNHAVINEDPNARIIRELREEVELLRSQLGNAGGGNLVEQLKESEKLMKEMTKTWEEKLQETDRIHEQRQMALEKMGISVQTSGIKVENDKNYLVNLNADPSLNELLVYYLKEYTKVGRPDAPTEQDIQLSGLGIMPEHALLIVQENTVYCTPLHGARTCVNGSVIQEQTLLRHGDRILWGNNHFFRINCPKIGTSNSFNENLSGGDSSKEPEKLTAWEYAQQELMLKELSNDPIQQAMAQLERQHEEDKQEALEKQRQMYEKQMELLLQQVGPGLGSPSGPQSLSPSSSLHAVAVADMNHLYTCWSPTNNRYGGGIQQRDVLFKQSLARLREDLIKANALVREANSLAMEMGRNVQFQVTLQIPAQNLSPRKRGVLLSEPAILVKRRNKENQIWSCDKLEDKIIKMREMYLGEEVHHPLEEEPNPDSDPFYESVENHKLIGVANVFMEALFHDVPLDYQVPIISQHGEVTGRLHIILQRIDGDLDRQNCYPLTTDDDSGSYVTCQLSIKDATGLPPSLANFVFCQYAFWGDIQPIVAAPDMAGSSTGKDSVTFAFNHTRQFKVRLSEEFIEHLVEGGALSIEIWGHRATGFTHGQNTWQVESLEAKSHSLVDRWTEVKRRVELWTEILELNEQGDYCPVEVTQNYPDVLTGGMYQLRQGHSRRIKVSVKPVANSGTLPIICESISSISVGSISARSKIQKGLDSYQEEDLNVLRDKWSEALNKRKAYLDEQIKRLMNKEDKSDQDTEREKALIDQWIGMTEERNAVLLPAPGSGIPGAPADWVPPPGIEQHIPVIFLDLNADDMSTALPIEGRNAAGINSILPKEHGGKMFTLPTLNFGDSDVCCVASWDSSIHDSIHLNRLTQTNERIYLILKCVVRLSHPAAMELILRKRLCINIYKRQSMMDKLKNRMSKADYVTSTGVTYEIVSNIPRASEEMEDRETLAMMAASGEVQEDDTGETYIEKYIRGVSNVESILALDRLRQEVALKETLTSRGQMLTMRKTVSVPNINHMGRSESFTYGLDTQYRADSVQDLTSSLYIDGYGSQPGGLTTQPPNAPPFGPPYTSTPISEGSFKRRSTSEAIPGGNKATGGVPYKPSVVSPQTKLVKPMMTVIEEKERKPLNDDGLPDNVNKSGSFITQIQEADEDDFQDFESYHSPPVPSSEPNEDNHNENQPPNNINTKHLAKNLTADFENCLQNEHANSFHDSLQNGSCSPKTSTHDFDNLPTEIPMLDDGIELSLNMTIKEDSDEEPPPNPEIPLPSLENSNQPSTPPPANKLPPKSTIHPEKPPPPQINPLSHKKQRHTLATSPSELLNAADHILSPLSPTSLNHSMISQQMSLHRQELENSMPGDPCSEEEEEDTLSTYSFGSRADLDHFARETPVPSWIQLGVSVTVQLSTGPQPGTVSYIGPTEFADNIWVGVSLDLPLGKNDGSVKGVRYFRCKKRHGVFVKHDKLIIDKKRQNRGSLKRQSTPSGRL